MAHETLLYSSFYYYIHLVAPPKRSLNVS